MEKPVALYTSHQVELQVGFGFFCPISECPDSVHIFLLDHLLLFQSPVYLLLHLNFVKTSLFIHAGLLPPCLDFLFIGMDFS